jgi:hypothetical protein
MAKKNEELRILNEYLAVSDKRNQKIGKFYINPWYIGKIANHIGVKKHTLRRILRKKEDLGNKKWENQ